MMHGHDMLDNNGAVYLQSDSGVTGRAGRALFWNDGGSDGADVGVCVYRQQQADGVDAPRFIELDRLRR
jgi:hypothetical protein